MDLVVRLLAGAGAAIPCGLSPLLPLIVLGVGGASKRATLYGPAGNVLANWVVVGVLALLVGLDVFADKLPRIEPIYTRINYAIRPLAGALAFAAVVPPEQLNIVLSLGLGLVLAALTYFARNRFRQTLASRSKTASIFQPLVSMGLDVVGFLLALLSLVLPVVGGPLALVVLLGLWVLGLNRKSPAAVGPSSSLSKSG